MTHLERLFAALYISEVWYFLYTDQSRSPRDKLYGRTRGIIMFDRIMAGEYDPYKDL